MCTDIVTVRTPIAYSNCTVATVHIGNSVHWYSDSEDWNGVQYLYRNTCTSVWQLWLPKITAAVCNIRSMKHELLTSHIAVYYNSRTAAQTVSPRPLIAQARVWSRASLCDDCGGPSGTGTGPFQYLCFPLSILHTLLHLQSAVTRTNWRRLGTFKQTNCVLDIWETLVSEVLYFLCLK